jgi:hypothetical protein
VASASAAVPTKLLFTGEYGRGVDLTQVNLKAGPALEDLCTVVSKDTCQPGGESSIAGGFKHPYSVAVAPPVPPATIGNVYVGDITNARVQEFTPTGEFVLMFGWDVNRTKVEEGASQTERNVCTAVSKDVCQAGEPGTGLSGQIGLPEDVAVDPATGDVFVAEEQYARVEEFTPEGKFVLMIGGNVDKTKVDAKGTEAERNLCTAVSKDECQAGQFAPHAFREAFAFLFGGLMTVGGPEDLLYVGDEQRVQEFKTNGEYKRELSLASISTQKASKAQALAVAGSGNVYVVDSANTHVIYEFNTTGERVAEFAMPGSVNAVALDPFGRLAVSEAQTSRGVLYSAAGEELSTFGPPGGMGETSGLAFNGSGELYVGDESRQDVEMYEPAVVAELLTGLVEDLTTSSVTLTGEANPEGPKAGEALVWFEYGTSEAYGSRTPVVNVGDGTAFVPVQAPLEGLLPNQKYHYRVAAEDKHDRAPEPPLAGKDRTFTTLALAPAVEGAPTVFDVTFSSAAFFGSVDPENAKTVYRFQYGVFAPGSCESLDACARVLESAPLESSAYGVLGATQTAAGLEPSSGYLVRLVAINEHGEETRGSETSFQTAPAPHPTAATGQARKVGATSATLTGLVDPDGAGATYSFQAGIYNGASTVYGTVVTGAAGEGTELEPEVFTLTGLQPGVTYACRIAISGSYAGNGSGVAYGEPVLFTTEGLPSVLVAPTPLALLPVPNIAFPAATATVTPTVKVRKPAPKKRKKARKPKRRKASKAAARNRNERKRP